MNRFSKSFLRKSVWEICFWALTSLKITSFYPDTFWLGLKSQVQSNFRFLEVVLPLSSSAISIAGGMLLFYKSHGIFPLSSVSWFLSLVLYGLFPSGNSRLPLFRDPFLLISSSVLLIFRCTFFILWTPLFSLMGQCCGYSTVCSQAVARVVGSFSHICFSWPLFQVSGLLVPQVSGNP